MTRATVRNPFAVIPGLTRDHAPPRRICRQNAQPLPGVIRSRGKPGMTAGESL
jgi:hypothetical protein